MAATFTLAVGLVIQAVVLTAYLARPRPPCCAPSPGCGGRPCSPASWGRLASEFWFLAFALATAASVRTLGLIDVLFAQGVTHILFKQKTTRREAAGIVLVAVIGVGLLVWAH